MTPKLINNVLVAAATLLASFLPHVAYAQQMNFSYYSDAYFSTDGQTLYTVIDGHDNSTGCTHYNFSNTGYVSGPSGSFQQGFSGLSSWVDVPLTGGNYSWWSDAVVDCSCFGSNLGAGGGSGFLPVDPIPSGETTHVNGWSGSATRFGATLNGGSFGGRSVREQQGGNDTDTCWWPGSSYLPIAGLSGGTWGVSGSNVYGDDYLDLNGYIGYYRGAGRAPCQAETDQIMQINQPNSAWVRYKTNRLKNGIGVSHIWNERDGVAASIPW